MRHKSSVPGHWLKGAMCLLVWGLIVSKGQAQFGPPPVVVVQPLGLSVQNGGTAVFTAVTASLPLLTTATWRCNGVDVPTPQMTLSSLLDNSGVVTTLTVTNVNSQNIGDYSVKVTCLGASTVSSNATLISLASVASILSSDMRTNGFHLKLGVATGSNYVLSASTDLKSWTPITTNTAPAGPVDFIDTNSLSFTCRFYKVATQ